MKYGIRNFGLPVVTALCVLLFSPFTPNANLIKELIWWSGLPLLAGAFFISMDEKERALLSQNCRILRIRFKGILIVLSLWLLWNILQAIRSSASFSAEIALIRFVSYLFTLFVFVLFFSKRRAIFYFMEFIAFASAICAIYTIMECLGVYFVNWTVKDRPPGTFANPNFTAIYLASFFPLILLWELFAKVAGTSPETGSENFLKRKISFKLIPFRSILILLALVATQSRAGFIALFSGVIVAGLSLCLILRQEKHGLQKSRKEKKLRGYTSSPYQPLIRPVLVGILIIEIFVASIFWFAPEKLNHIFNATTVQLRLQLWKGSLLLFKERPLFGWGLGSFGTVSQRILYLVEPMAGKKHAIHAHSWLFELLVEHGAMGATLFIIMLLFIFRRFMKSFIKSGDVYEKLLIGGVIAGLAALLAGTLFGVWFNWWGGGWTFWILTGLGVSVSSGVSKDGQITPDSPIPASSVIFRKSLLLKTIGVLFILLCFFTSTIGYNVFRAEILIRKGHNLLRSSKFNDALELFERAEKLPHHSPGVIFWKAVCLYNLKKDEEAEEVLQSLIAKQSKVSKNYMLMGQIKAREGNLGEAEKYLKWAYAIEPNGENAKKLANFYLAQKELGKALSIMEKQLGKAIYPPLLHFYLKVEKEQGRTAEARTFISQLRENLPFLKRKQKGELARWEAELSSIQGDLVGAMRAYQTSLIYDPQNYEVWNDYALVLRDLGRLSRADRAYARAEKIAPGNFVPTYNRLELAILRKDYVLTRQLADKLKKLNLPPEASRRLEDIITNVLPSHPIPPR